MTGNLVTIDFHGDTLEACEKDGKVWANLRRLCENIGVAFSPQLRKLKSETWACMIEMITHDVHGRQQVMTMIDRDTIPGWLFTIKTGKVKPEIRVKLERYKADCARVLADHFLKRPSPPVSTVPAVPYANRDIRLVEADLLRNLVLSQIAQEKNLAVVVGQLDVVAGVAVAAYDEVPPGTQKELALVRQELATAQRDAKEALRAAGAAYRHATAGATPVPPEEDPTYLPTWDGLYTVVGWLRANGLRLPDLPNEVHNAGKRAKRRCETLKLRYRKILRPYQPGRDHDWINVYDPEAIRLAVEKCAISIYPRGGGPTGAPALPANPSPGVPVVQTNSTPGGL